MPGLLDIATVTVGKQRTANAENALLQYSRGLYRPPLSIKNKLKTQFYFGDESKLGKMVIPAESDGVFASWRKELNRQPAADVFELQPINKVKTPNDAEELKELELEIRHKEWLKEIDTRLKKLGFKR